MKKYWAARRGGSKTAESTSSEAAAKTTKPARGSAKRGPRTLSSEARKRISDAQKARWVKQRGEGKTTASSSATEATAAKGRRAAKRPGPAGVKRGPRKLSATARKRMSHSQKKRWAAKRAAQ